MPDGMVLSSELSMKMDNIIGKLRQKLNPNCIILADISGQLLSSYVSNIRIDVSSLAALFASNIGATSAIAEKIKETAGFDTMLHEGKNYNIFLSKIGKSYLLAVVFSRSDQIGMVRLFTKKASQELLVLSREYEKQNKNATRNNIGNKFTDKLAVQLTDILNEAEIN